MDQSTIPVKIHNHLKICHYWWTENAAEKTVLFHSVPKPIREEAHYALAWKLNLMQVVQTIFADIWAHLKLISFGFYIHVFQQLLHKSENHLDGTNLLDFSVDFPCKLI